MPDSVPGEYAVSFLKDFTHSQISLNTNLPDKACRADSTTSGLIFNAFHLFVRFKGFNFNPTSWPQVSLRSVQPSLFQLVRLLAEIVDTSQARLSLVGCRQLPKHRNPGWFVARLDDIPNEPGI